MRILMVCLGNICRSPLAEGILQHKIDTQKLEDWSVDSAGTGSWHVGDLPDERSIDVARKHGIDITGQCGRQFTAGDFDRFDKVLVMDSSNYQNVMKLARTDADRNKVALIMNYDRPGFNEAVPDPYWDDNGFDKVYEMLDRATDKLIRVESQP